MRRPTKRTLSLLWLVAAALLVGTAFGERGFTEVAQNAQRVNDLRAQVVKREAQIASLKDQIWLLQNDDLVIERLAREELGMIGENELVVLLEGTSPRSLGEQVLAERSSWPIRQDDLDNQSENR